ncbi:MAG: hypothetical protein N2381_00155 [Armatimonadetes bacterium]|nr:hypothetical protein [Armatimonadota bacterium]
MAQACSQQGAKQDAHQESKWRHCAIAPQLDMNHACQDARTTSIKAASNIFVAQSLKDAKDGKDILTKVFIGKVPIQHFLRPYHTSKILLTAARAFN